MPEKLFLADFHGENRLKSLFLPQNPSKNHVFIKKLLILLYILYKYK